MSWVSFIRAASSVMTACAFVLAIVAALTIPDIDPMDSMQMLMLTAILFHLATREVP